jgi:glycosyltransferase involved in cell wall biosynthesis
MYLPHIGGVELIVNNLSKEFHKKSHRVRIVAAKTSWQLKSYEIIDGIEVYRTFLVFPGISFKHFLAFPFLAPIGLFRLWRVVRADKPDLINLHFVDGSGFYGLCLKRLLDLPLVVTLQGNDVQKFPKRSRLQRMVFERLLKEADFITACSSSLLDQAREFVPEIEEKSLPIPNGIDLDEFSLKEAYQSRRPYLFALGRLEHKKGFDLLIKAFKPVLQRFPQLDLILAGDGPERDRLIKLINQLDLKERVKLPGRVNRKEVVKLFNGCQLFVLSSRSEGLPVVSLEAMAASKAILATKVDGVPEVVIDGENGVLIEPENVNELYKGISYLMGQERLREEMGKRGRQLVVERYSWPKLVERYLDVYMKVSNRC